jgi:hypothetical protein
MNDAFDPDQTSKINIPRDVESNPPFRPEGEGISSLALAAIQDVQSQPVPKIYGPVRIT